MTETERRQIIALVKSEVIPAIGCTEPIAVALCVAKAAEVLNKRPEKITVLLSANILKNAMGVGIPGTGMIGLLQRMRTDHRIEYVVVRGSCRYRLSEILRLLEDNTVRNEEGTIDTLFHNHTLRTGGKPKGRRT